MGVFVLLSDLKFWARSVAVYVGLIVLLEQPTNAQQRLRLDSPDSCDAQNGTLTGGNLVTDFDNGTFGVENGDPGQSPSPPDDPYPGQVGGGNFDNFFDFDFGDYGYVANPVIPRNRAQHDQITDPVFGAIGRFFAADPDNDNTPTLNFNITNIVPNENYELSFWAANSEPNGAPNILNAQLDGIVSFSTGELTAFPDELEWRRHAFVFNAGDRISVQLSIASTVEGTRGLDFYVDNVRLEACELASSGGSITGHVYEDGNRNNAFDAGSDGPLVDIQVQLWDAQGDSDPANDVFVSATSSGVGGVYLFSNISPSTTYTLRVVTTDADLPAGAVFGTPDTLNVPSVMAGSTSGNFDFGFDLTSAVLEAAKTTTVFDPLSEGHFALPGNDVIYTITITNHGDGETDPDTVLLVDDLPPEVIFFNGDADGAGPGTGSVIFADAGSGLSFDPANDVGFAVSGPQPSNFAACNYSPTVAYDPLIAFVCINPKGTLLGGDPNPSFGVSFRARIR